MYHIEVLTVRATSALGFDVTCLSMGFNGLTKFRSVGPRDCLAEMITP
jgi:hypothetical protein